MRGIRYHCETCFNFDLCCKCYLSRKVIHPSDHEFAAIGPEYSTESEGSESEEDVSEVDEGSSVYEEEVD